MKKLLLIILVFSFPVLSLAGINDGLISYYPLDGDPADSIGIFDGVEHNGITYAAGLSGQAASFDGVNDYLDLPENVINATSGSVSLWFKCQTLSSTYGYIFSSASSGSPAGTRRYIYMQAEELVRGMFMNTVLADTSVNHEQWYHAVLTWNSNESAFYLNGNLKGVGPGGAPTPLKVNLGSYGEGMNSFFDGLIDEVKIYNRALSAADIQDLYQLNSNNDDTDLQKITGNVTYNGVPVCAMVLANGQYMFTCSGDGSFDLDVPLDANEEITVFTFCSGLAPYKQIITPGQGSGMQIHMLDSEGGEGMDVDYSLQAMNSTWALVEGTLAYNGAPICAMALANGQYQFTCSGDGSFSLLVPLDDMGSITLFNFCEGLPPYQTIYTTSQIDFNYDYDDDGYTVAAGDCNDFNAAIYPGVGDCEGDPVDTDVSYVGTWAGTMITEGGGYRCEWDLDLNLSSDHIITQTSNVTYDNTGDHCAGGTTICDWAVEDDTLSLTSCRIVRPQYMVMPDSVSHFTSPTSLYDQRSVTIGGISAIQTTVWTKSQ